jgi:hypothetical protein
MVHDIIKAYADAMYVATTLRPPPPVGPDCESDDTADGAARLARLSGWLAAWLRTRLGRGFGATAKSAPSIRTSFTRAPHP